MRHALPNRSAPPALGWAIAQVNGKAVLAYALPGQAPKIIHIELKPLK